MITLSSNNGLLLIPESAKQDYGMHGAWEVVKYAGHGLRLHLDEIYKSATKHQLMRLFLIFEYGSRAER